MSKLKRECDNYVYSDVRFRKDYEKIGDHTIKKFELVSEYAKGWAHKILGYSQSAGFIQIDCICNCRQPEQLIKETV